MGFWDGSGISQTICKQSAPHSRQITIPTPHHSIFTGWMLFLMPNQQYQSKCLSTPVYYKWNNYKWKASAFELRDKTRHTASQKRRAGTYSAVRYAVSLRRWQPGPSCPVLHPEAQWPLMWWQRSSVDWQLHTSSQPAPKKPARHAVNNHRTLDNTTTNTHNIIWQNSVLLLLVNIIIDVTSLICGVYTNFCRLLCKKCWKALEKMHTKEYWFLFFCLTV